MENVILEKIAFKRDKYYLNNNVLLEADKKKINIMQKIIDDTTLNDTNKKLIKQYTTIKNIKLFQKIITKGQKSDISKIDTKDLNKFDLNNVSKFMVKNFKNEYVKMQNLIHKTLKNSLSKYNIKPKAFKRFAIILSTMLIVEKKEKRQESLSKILTSIVDKMNSESSNDKKDDNNIFLQTWVHILITSALIAFITTILMRIFMGAMIFSISPSILAFLIICFLMGLLICVQYKVR